MVSKSTTTVPSRPGSREEVNHARTRHTHAHPRSCCCHCICVAAGIAHLCKTAHGQAGQSRHVPSCVALCGGLSIYLSICRARPEMCASACVYIGACAVLCCIALLEEHLPSCLLVYPPKLALGAQCNPGQMWVLEPFGGRV